MSGRRAGCPGLREVPDVRAGVADSSALWIACAGFPGRRQMSGGSGRAGCPGLWPDVRAEGVQLLNAFCDGRRMSVLWPDVRACGKGRMSGLGPNVQGL